MEVRRRNCGPRTGQTSELRAADCTVASSGPTDSKTTKNNILPKGSMCALARNSLRNHLLALPRRTNAKFVVFVVFWSSRVGQCLAVGCAPNGLSHPNSELPQSRCALQEMRAHEALERRAVNVHPCLDR